MTTRSSAQCTPGKRAAAKKIVATYDESCWCRRPIMRICHIWYLLNFLCIKCQSSSELVSTAQIIFFFKICFQNHLKYWHSSLSLQSQAMRVKKKLPNFHRKWFLIDITLNQYAIPAKEAEWLDDCPSLTIWPKPFFKSYPSQQGAVATQYTWLAKATSLPWRVRSIRCKLYPRQTFLKTLIISIVNSYCSGTVIYDLISSNIYFTICLFDLAFLFQVLLYLELQELLSFHQGNL